MNRMDKIKDLDLYLLLGVDPDANKTVIKKAFRKKALTCHPDKNPDNPQAADLFYQLSEALAVLTDEKAKAAYDKLLKARKRREIKGATTEGFSRCFSCKLDSKDLIKEKKTLKACGRCKIALYCSSSCQNAHYSGHKITCLEFIEKPRKEGKVIY